MAVDVADVEFELQRRAGPVGLLDMLEDGFAAAGFPAVDEKFGRINRALRVVRPELPLPRGIGSTAEAVFPSQVVPVVDMKGQRQQVEFVGGRLDEAG